MQQRQAENCLSVIYTLCTFFGATASITAGIAWSHWKDTLNQCGSNLDYRNCSCIFYGKHTPRYFLGGDTASCVWITFGPLLYVFLSVGLACYHGFRVLFGAKENQTRTITSKNDAGETIIMQAVHHSSISILSRCYWIFAATLTTFLTLYSLVHFSFYIDGYFHTCKQYRQTLVNILRIDGTVSTVLHARLGCNSVFDFMDYIQPDTGNAYRDGIINTAADLIIGIITSLFAWVLFLYASVINIIFARKKL